MWGVFLNNITEIILGGVYTGFVFWLGRKSVGFNVIEAVKNLFVRR